MILRNKHIFIVEDNLSNRIVFQKSLNRQGAQVIFERWGRDTLYTLQNTAAVDLIVLDLMLADGISGFDVFDEIRTLPEISTVPVIAVSAMDAALAIPRTRAQGFAAFIAKPIDSHRFPEQIAAILAGETIWDSGATMSP